ncbi:helix-turn-helix domain-containing protein [Corynebacterium pacaense]|uniref:helix-turn-helix domain-containing protein n=1 Tax=Corynebacterium pacaense TaxID=1816684 RepID=UPI0009BB97F7|nr:helix-turn-helix transcriptional regulator [Corynebacterium pacaense]
MKIEELIALAAEQPTRISRRSGVSRSTLKRVGDGTSEPTLSTLREVALALGLDITVTAGQASDPYAAAAARTLIDDSVPEDPNDQAVVEWLDRFGRWGIDDPLTLVSEAGIVQGIAHRAGARFYRGDLRGLELIDAHSGPWALSGAAAAALTLGRYVEGTTVLWHAGGGVDKHDFGERVDTAAEADLIVLPAAATELSGHYGRGNLFFVAPVQLVIDLHSLGMYEEAEILTGGWR